MSITVSIKDLSEYYSFEPVDSDLHNIATSIVSQINKTELFLKPQFLLNKDDAVSSGVENPEQKSYEIEIYFFNDITLFSDFLIPLNSSEYPLGFHANNAGIFEDIDQDLFAAKHRVFIYLDNDYFFKLYKEEKSQFDDFNFSHSFLYSFFNTITHECIHAYEYLTHSNGLTPLDVYNLNSCGDLSFSSFEISTGLGILFDDDDSYSESEIIEIMEDRVEEKGMILLNSLELPKKSFSNLINKLENIH